MTPDVVLQKAIQKAISNGYDIGYHSVTSHMVDNDPHTIIFSHDFAKAFWGEEETTISTDMSDGGEKKDQFMKRYRPDQNITKEKEYEWNQLVTQPAWQHHLQQMVLEENPLEYLQKFL